jgi:hypothetical protein
MAHLHVERSFGILSAAPRQIYRATVALLLAITGFLHFWKLGSAPAGFYGDESSIAYNAYCIALTGADEYGTRYPVFFRGFDNYHDPVMVYALVPLVKTLGLKEWVARLPSAVFHLLAAVMFALLVQRYCRNRWISLASGLVFSVIPWAFPVSRTVSAGYTAMLLGMSAGWLWLLEALGRRSHGYAVAAAGAWAFAMYAHNIGRPMTALLLICFVVGGYRVVRARWKVALTFSAGLLVGLLPMIVWVLRRPEALTTRFQIISVFRDHPPLPVLLERVGARFVEYFSPGFLFLSGDSNLRHHTGRGGELFWFLAPLVLAGLYGAIRFFRRQPPYRFLLLGTLVYPVAACLTLGHLHSMRCVNGVIFWMLLAAVGARLLWQQKAIGRKLLLVILCAGIVEVPLYLFHYFGPYQVSCRGVFQYELVDALRYCFRHLGNGRVFYISPSTFSPYGATVNAQLKPYLYADVLFCGKIDPRQYQRTGFPMDTVQLYRGVASRPGLLLRCNYFHVAAEETRPRAYAVFDDLPLPSGAKLVKANPFTERNPSLQYQVFEIPQGLASSTERSNPIP